MFADRDDKGPRSQPYGRFDAYEIADFGWTEDTATCF